MRFIAVLLLIILISFIVLSFIDGLLAFLLSLVATWLMAWIVGLLISFLCFIFLESFFLRSVKNKPNKDLIEIQQTNREVVLVAYPDKVRSYATSKGKIVSVVTFVIAICASCSIMYILVHFMGFFNLIVFTLFNPRLEVPQIIGI